MARLSNDDLIVFLLAISAMLILARIISELGKK